MQFNDAACKLDAGVCSCIPMSQLSILACHAGVGLAAHASMCSVPFFDIAALFTVCCHIVPYCVVTGKSAVLFACNAQGDPQSSCQL